MRTTTILPSALAAVTILAALGGGCDGSIKVPPGTTTTDTTSTSTSGSTTTSGTGGTGGGTVNPNQVWSDCQASDQAWVRRAILAVSGRRALGQGEVNAYEDLLVAVRGAESKPAAGPDLESGKRVVARALMQESAFRERWSDFLLDALRVNRIEIKSQQACYGPPIPDAIDDGALAAYVRDSDPASTAPPLQGFTMGQLLSSALALDDLSVVYRGNLFAMLNLPIYGANVGPEAMERIQRQDFGAVFSAAYIHRDIVCLNCHNSEFSVTFDEDPAKNRHWAIPGLFEQAIYGASNGRHPPEEAATKGSDTLRAFSVFRVMGVVGGGALPWGWASDCGSFQEPTTDDPLGIDAFFGSVRSTPAAPTKGLRASVWDLERALHRGVSQLAAHGLVRGPQNEIADPDEAFAYLVAENIVEKVWDEVMGHRLTIASYFPRNQISRDTLMTLTDHFVAKHFSLKTLIFDILAHPAFNLQAPDEGCGKAAYEVPNLFDPWTISESDASKRPNSTADGVFAISARPLVRSLHRAMQWPFDEEYPSDDSFQSAIGFFLKDGEPGFRGLDFQGRLTWEETYGRCFDWTFGADFIGQIGDAAKALPNATIEQGVIALKDRLLGEPSIDALERAGFEMLTGGPLSSTNLAELDPKLRQVCGVLVSTPQFMLGGIAPKDTRDVPALTPKSATYGAVCSVITQQVVAAGEPFAIGCAGGKVTATAK